MSFEKEMKIKNEIIPIEIKKLSDLKLIILKKNRPKTFNVITININVYSCSSVIVLLLKIFINLSISVNSTII